MTNYAIAQKEAAVQVEAVLAEAKELPMQASYRFDGDGLKFVVAPTRGYRGGGSGGPQSSSMAQIEAVRNRISSIAETYGRHVVDLVNEREAIRAEIGQAIGSTKSQSVDSTLFAAMRVATARENESLYRDYRIAVFQPGLSPGQRQLLFDSMLEQLNLPLPRGEMQPIYRSNSW